MRYRKWKRKLYLKTKPNILSKTYWSVKFINKIMQKGRKAAAEKIVFHAFNKIKIEFHKNAWKILYLALIKNRPLLGFAPIRLGREIKQIPIPLSARRQLVISLKWFITAMKLIRYDSGKVSMEEVLYTQLKAFINKEKTILTRRRIDHIKELIENRVNLHHRWK